jgi:4-amino-4-deoxy-L-arabinose transferase-like glycosyltransferase
MKSIHNSASIAIILVISLCCFLPFIGSMNLYDWDEVNFAEMAREMLETKNWLQLQIGFVPFYEKPPLFIWMQALSMSVFGVNEFAARFPNVVCGVFTLIIMYAVGKKLRGGAFGWLWILSYLVSFLPHLYFKSAIIDPWFNLFIFLAVYNFYLVYTKESTLQYQCMGSVFVACAFLTKGPVGLILSFVPFGIFLLMKRKSSYIVTKGIFVLILTLIISSSWFVYETYVHGFSYLKQFFLYQVRLFTTEDAEHGGFFLFHPVVLMLGCFPVSAFLFYRIKNTFEDKLEFEWCQLMLIVLVFVVVLFTIVQTKIVHYSSMAYFPLTYLAARNIEQIFKGDLIIHKANKWILYILSFIWGLILILILLAGLNPAFVRNKAPDGFIKQALEAQVDWCTWEFGLGIIIVTALFLGLRYLSSYNIQKGFIILMGTMIISNQFIIYRILPKIEKYSQGAMIDFIKSKSHELVYFNTIQLKSYAIYFYSKIKPYSEAAVKNREWMLFSADLDRDCYFIARTEDWIPLKPNAIGIIEEVESKNGYVLLVSRKKLK